MTRERTGATSSRYPISPLFIISTSRALLTNGLYCWKQSLTVLDYLLHAGSENVVIYFRDNIYIIKTLKEFQYVDEYGKDQGANVRQKAKDITNLLTDEGRLRQERRSRASMRDRMLGAPGDDDGLDGDENSRRRAHSNPPARKRDEDELTKAIEASKRSLAEEQARGAEDRDLAEAMRLSKEEEERRARAAQDSGPLFDDQQNDLYVLFYPVAPPPQTEPRRLQVGKSKPARGP